MKLFQIYIVEDEHVDFSGLDPDVVDKLKSFPSHFQQWAVGELRKGGNSHSVVDALVYFKDKIRDNRFIDILKKFTSTPRNVLSLSLDEIKSAQAEFDESFGGASKRELKKIRRASYARTLVDEPNLKIIKFEKIDDTDNAAKILSDYARGTKWCVTDVATGDEYLCDGPIYLINRHLNYFLDESKADEDKIPYDTDGSPLELETDKLLCHVISGQLMDPTDNPVLLDREDVVALRPYIPDIAVFSNLTNRVLVYLNPEERVEARRDYLEAIVRVPSLAVATAVRNDRRFVEAEPYIMKSPKDAVDYAIKVLRLRWPEAEPFIVRSGAAVLKYLTRLSINEVIPGAEAGLLKSPWAALKFAGDVRKARWPEAEAALFRELSRGGDHDALFNYAIDYAAKFYADGWPELEKYLARSYKAALYCMRVIHRRWPEAEPYIMASPYLAARYATEVIGGRWPEAEAVINSESIAKNEYEKGLRRVGEKHSAYQNYLDRVASP